MIWRKIGRKKLFHVHTQPLTLRTHTYIYIYIYILHAYIFMHDKEGISIYKCIYIDISKCRWFWRWFCTYTHTQIHTDEHMFVGAWHVSNSHVHASTTIFNPPYPGTNRLVKIVARERDYFAVATLVTNHMSHNFASFLFFPFFLLPWQKQNKQNETNLISRTHLTRMRVRVHTKAHAHETTGKKKKIYSCNETQETICMYI